MPTPRYIDMLRACAALFLFGATMSTAATPPVLNFTLNPLLPGKPVALNAFAGKPVLVVNVASQCGYTGQYKDLEALHAKYKDQGLVVIGVPANDFGAQEPGSNAEIAQFCQKNYGVSFQMVEKLDAPLPKQPLHAALIKASGEAPKWNFHKYLIDRNGGVQSFGSAVEPMSATLTRAVESALRN